MQILPVLDIKGGQAVHAVAGQRSQYQPLTSVWHTTPDPVALARGLRDRLGVTELYLADLDAIEGRAAPAWEICQALADLGLSVWADVGVRDGQEVATLGAVGVDRVVVGSETSTGPPTLARIVGDLGPERLVWSLDLRAGVPILPPVHAWQGDPTDEDNLVDQAVAVGVESILRLDLALVGTGQGTAIVPPAPTGWPGVAWFTGGGVASGADLDVLNRLGYRAVLVGSAVHDGRIGREDFSARRTS